jgi:hypothetical protein
MLPASFPIYPVGVSEITIYPIGVFVKGENAEKLQPGIRRVQDKEKGLLQNGKHRRI